MARRNRLSENPIHAVSRRVLSDRAGRRLRDQARRHRPVARLDDHQLAPTSAPNAELRRPGGESFSFTLDQAPLSGWRLQQWMASFGQPSLPERRLSHWLPHPELLDQLETPGDFELLRGARAALPARDLRRLALEGITGRPGSYAAASIETLDSLGPESATAPLVLHYLRRLRPRSAHPYSAWCACRFLLARDFEPALVLQIAHQFADVRRVKGFRGNPFDERWAELLLEYDPHRALPRVAQALRSATPACWHGAAGLLAAIDQPWCRRTLEGALREAPDPGRTDPRGMEASRRRTLAAALSLSTDAYARSVAAEYLPPPPTPSERLGFTYDEATHEDIQSRVTAKAHAVREVAARLRGRLPADLDRAQKPCP